MSASVDERRSHLTHNHLLKLDSRFLSKVGGQIQQNKRWMSQNHANAHTPVKSLRSFSTTAVDGNQIGGEKNVSRLGVSPDRHVTWRKLLCRRASPGAEQHQRTTAISPESHNIIHATRKQNCTCGTSKSRFFTCVSLIIVRFVRRTWE